MSRTPEEIAAHVMNEARSGRLGDQNPKRTEALIASAIAGVIEACAKIAEEQPYFHDTTTGMRQQYVKDQIAARIRDLGAK